MDVIFETKTRKMKNTLVIWNVDLPRPDIPAVSKSFQVYDYRWTLKLNIRVITDNYGHFRDEVCEMSLRHSESKSSPLIPLRVYIRNGGKDIYISQKEIDSADNIIWCTGIANFRKMHPDIQIVGTPLQFVFDFHLAILNPEIPITVSKSVQTPNTITCAEDHACLQSLSLDLCKLVEDGSDPDVQLKCGDFSMGAHKLILGARSEVFHNMMKSDMMEGRERSVEIIDMEPKILKVFIRYIYTGILSELTEDIALPLYEAADKYQVEALKKRSGHFLAENVSPENALRILATADAHSDIDLKGRLVSYIVREKIPSREAEWLKFCNQYPMLANEVLNLCYKLSSCSE